MSPFFSIIVPTYNVEAYLGPALDSLLAQTDPDWEAVIVNDGSTDGTARVMEEYGRRDPRFRAFHKPNGGTASAMNEGLKHVRGEWICWLSSDDLFDPRKLEQHRRWIAKTPAGRFFCSYFRMLDNETGRVVDEPLWQPVPAAEWQVIEMLRCTYVHGNSICVQRDAWRAAGLFDPACGYGQDYDMWLRLAARFAVTLVPEYTCVTRESPSLGTRGFLEARYYGAAKSGIRFLNAHRFEELFPFTHLEEPARARAALDRALDVAAGPHSYLYALGPHLALVLRIMEWLWREPADDAREPLREHFRRRAAASARSHAGTHLGWLWKAAAAAACLPGRRFEYRPVDVVAVAETQHGLLARDEAAQAAPLRRYLEQFESRAVPAAGAAPPGPTRDVVVVAQIEAEITYAVPYGALRMTLEAAKYMMRAGRRVLLVGLSELGLGYVDGVPFMGAGNNVDLLRALARLAPLDGLVGVTRADVLLAGRFRRAVVYQHNLGEVQGGVPPAVLNRARVQVACVSLCSRATLQRAGLEPSLLRLVPNAYDAAVFHAGGAAARPPHRLVFAGNLDHYKGVDTLLEAFVLLRARFPDVELDLYGVPGQPWPPDAVRPDAWLDRRGYFDGRRAQAELPGVRCHGNVHPTELAEAFRRCSLLVMPSRTDNFPLVSLEAQACGCLPVLPRTGGMPETLRPEETGFLYDENTPQGLADRVAALWEAGRPSAREREAAAAWVRETFSWDRTGAALLAALESADELSGSRWLGLLLLRCRLRARYRLLGWRRD